MVCLSSIPDRRSSFLTASLPRRETQEGFLVAAHPVCPCLSFNRPPSSASLLNVSLWQIFWSAPLSSDAVEAAIKEVFREGATQRGASRSPHHGAVPWIFHLWVRTVKFVGVGTLHTFSMLGRVAETWKGVVTKKDKEWRHLSYFLDVWPPRGGNTTLVV